MNGFLDRSRTSRLLRQAGLSALVLCQPESITYATGAFPGVATFWRRAGAAFVVIPADANAQPVAIVGDLQARTFAQQSAIKDVRSHRLWVETDRFPLDDSKLKRLLRPTQYDLSASLNLLGDALRELGLAGTRIGLELGFVPVADFALFQAMPFDWQDGTRIVEGLRSVKSPEEVARLRRAASYAAAGFSGLIARLGTGQTAAQMADIWREEVAAAATASAENLPLSSWSFIAVGGDGFAPGGPARAGDLVKIDVGCVLGGYSSDGARTVALGKPSAEAQHIYDALHGAFEAGLPHFRPGTALREIHEKVASTMWNKGFETYGRGHFGHGVGASIWSEEWPFIGADSDAVLEPNMVMAFETPWYIDGLGGFIIEDQLLITETGHEVMSPLPRSLQRVAVS
ncbi:MAG: Xaa-Pro peptidase family protein [Proteobacteria bacterium]|nr:Xaa-Pro peptidase family protein [Pseudomonadota bacterium]